MVHHNKYHIYLVVFFDEVETTVIGDESCDLLSVLDELDSDTLTNSRVRLLSLNTNLLKNNSLGVRGSTERIGLPSGSQVSLFVVLVGPDLVAPVVDVLTGGLDS